MTCANGYWSRVARELAEDTLTPRRQVLGDDHPKTLNTAYKLVTALNRLGEHCTTRELASDDHSGL